MPAPRPAALTLTLLFAFGTIVAGQSDKDSRLQVMLKSLFPTATSFGPKEGIPQHYKAFAPDPKTGQPAVIGYGFWTTELEPLERGYEGPIKMFMGLDTKGTITGLFVVEHHEPFGKISVEPPKFAAQFKGKSVKDKFVVGEDVDAVATATITVTSANRAIKKSARRIATAYLAPPTK